MFTDKKSSFPPKEQGHCAIARDGKLTYLQEKTNRFIIDPMNVTSSVKPNLKLLFSACKGILTHDCPIHAQLDWDSGNLGHTSLPRGGPITGSGVEVRLLSVSYIK